MSKMKRAYEVVATAIPGAPKIGTLFFPVLDTGSERKTSGQRSSGRRDNSRIVHEYDSNLERRNEFESSFTFSNERRPYQTDRSQQSRHNPSLNLRSDFDNRPIFLYDEKWLETGFAIGADLPLGAEPIRPPDGMRTFAFLKERSIDRVAIALLRDALTDASGDVDGMSARSRRTLSRFGLKSRIKDGGAAAADAEDASPDPAPSSADFGLEIGRGVDRLFAGGLYSPEELSGVRLPHAFRHGGGIDLIENGAACGIRTRTASESTSLDALIYAFHANEHGRAHANDRLRLAADAVLGGRRTRISVMHKRSECAVTLRRLDDPIDVPVWRAVALTLARRAGIETLDFTIRSAMGTAALLTDRFDRTIDSTTKLRTAPLLTLSAEALLPVKPLGRGFAAPRPGRLPYLALADILNRTGASPKTDLPAMWRRMAFSVMLGAKPKTSDWQFARTSLDALGWRLLPMHSISILPRDWATGSGATLDGRTPLETPEACIAYARYFAISMGEAKTAIFEMRRALADWERVAADFGADPREIELIASVFEEG